MPSLETIAEQFCHAFYERTWRGDADFAFTRISVPEAYAVQDRVAGKRETRGERVVGYKVGCTSHAIRRQFGLEEPIRAYLFDPHVYGDGVRLDWSAFLKCAIEPELVITMGRPVRSKGLTDAQLIASIENLGAGIELHHYHFWHQPPTLQELICSGGLHAGLVVGPRPTGPKPFSFREEVFIVYVDGERVTEAPASEIMGGPLRSLRWLSDSLIDDGLFLDRGDLVIPGSPTELVSIDHDITLTVEIERVGSVTAYFESPD